MHTGRGEVWYADTQRISRDYCSWGLWFIVISCTNRWTYLLISYLVFSCLRVGLCCSICNPCSVALFVALLSVVWWELFVLPLPVATTSCHLCTLIYNHVHLITVTRCPKYCYKYIQTKILCKHKWLQQVHLCRWSRLQSNEEEKERPKHDWTAGHCWSPWSTRSTNQQITIITLSQRPSTSLWDAGYSTVKIGVEGGRTKKKTCKEQSRVVISDQFWATMIEHVFVHQKTNDGIIWTLFWD